MQREALENRTDAGPPRPTATAGTLARARRVIRRRYWVDWRSQLPIIVLGVGSTLFFVVMFNLTLLALSAARRDAIIESVPAMEERLLQQDIAFHRRIYVASGCLVVFVNIGLLVLTQRSAGPIRRIESHLRRIAAGDLDHQVRLRKRDHLHSLADHCNQVIEALRARAQAEVVSLAQAERALRSGGPAERQAAGAALERLLRDKQGVPAAAHPAPEPGAPVTV